MSCSVLALLTSYVESSNDWLTDSHISVYTGVQGKYIHTIGTWNPRVINPA